MHAIKKPCRWKLFTEEKRDIVKIIPWLLAGGLDFGNTYHSDGFGLEIGLRAAVYCGRIIMAAKYHVRVDGIWYSQSFGVYRSTGTATPDRSPEGTWWPTLSGVTSSGVIGKDLWDFHVGQSMHHGKRAEAVNLAGIPHGEVSRFLESNYQEAIAPLIAADQAKSRAAAERKARKALVMA